MHLIGRFDRVRELGSKGWGRPYVLDRRPYPQGNPVLRPFADRGEWWRSPEGIWLPTISGGAFLGRRETPQANTLGWVADGSVLAQTTLALDSAYAYNSGGDAFGIRIEWLESLGALTNVYYYIATDAVGTQANINDINAEFRSGGVLNPGSTLHDSGSADPNGEATWIGWHCIPWGTGFTPVTGTEYWVSIGDADGNGTDYATISEGIRQTSSVGFFGLIKAPFDTSNGWLASSGKVAATAVVLQCGTNIVGGCHATVITPNNTTNRRGWRIGGFTETLSLLGMINYSTLTTPTGLEYYADASTLPGSATSSTTVAARILSGSGGPAGYVFAAPVQPAKATACRLVFSFSGANTTTRKYSMGAGNGYNTDAILRKARVGGAGWYWAEANGTSDWSNDDLDSQPSTALLVEDQVAEPTDAEIATAIWAYGNRTLSA